MGKILRKFYFFILRYSLPDCFYWKNMSVVAVYIVYAFKVIVVIFLFQTKHACTFKIQISVF